LLYKNSNIKDIHHLHIWALSSSENALTAHIKLKEDVKVVDHMSIKKDIKHELIHHNIQHLTLELERSDDDCEEEDCYICQY
jgi:cobalt-zinc-cadmium efflux system protein